MTVVVLRLSGLETDDALNAANQLFDIRAGGPPRLRRLLVVDDADRLVEHEPVYDRLNRGRRVQDMLCVAVGPLAAADGKLALPETLGGSQGTGVVWVGDELGIDWRFGAPTADGHGASRVSGLSHVVELLTDDDLFNRVHEAFLNEVPGKIASPGLWLAGADAEDATFAAALAMAVSRMSGPGPGSAGAFYELLPDAAGGAVLASGGRLARDRDEVAEWVAAAAKDLEKNSGLGKLLGRGGTARDHVIEAGAILSGLRDEVAQLLHAAHAAGQPSEQQYQLMKAAGIELPSVDPGRPADAADSPVYRTVAESVKSGDTLPLIVERLQATEHGLERKGSASYLPEVAARCSQQLLAQLADPPQRLPRSADGAGRAALGLDQAEHAAGALTELAISAANSEWSLATPSAALVARVRIALSSAWKTLSTDAHGGNGGNGGTRSGTRKAQVASRAEALRPVLCSLLLRVVAAACEAHGATGIQARTAAGELTTRLLKQWREHVHDHGMSEPPPFAAADAVEMPGFDANEGEAAEIREAVLYGAEKEMWQLCLPDDLDMLELSAEPYIVRFAPRLNREALAGTVPADTVWTSSGAYAGLLRFIPLQGGLVAPEWPEGGW